MMRVSPCLIRNVNSGVGRPSFYRLADRADEPILTLVAFVDETMGMREEEHQQVLSPLTWDGTNCHAMQQKLSELVISDVGEPG
jgi:hypothetical protein